MIRLGLRLTLHGGREALARLIVIAAAVSIGVAMLLVTLAGVNALKAQDARAAWLDSSSFGPPPVPGETGPRADPLWWWRSTDAFGNRLIDRVDVAATGANSPIPPGIPALPRAGQFYVSPALGRLLASVPAAELAARFPGRRIGTIGPAALPSPDSLIIVIGRPVAQLAHVGGADRILAVNTTAGAGQGDQHSSRLQVILAIGALTLLFPVLVLIGTATRLSAARREQRFAAMRLVGATPRQVSVLSAVESTLATVAGVTVGFALFLALRPVLTPVSFTGAPFAPGDLSLTGVDVALVAVGVPLAGALAARIALRRVQISPLGVTRRATPPAPRARRLLVLAAGVGELAWFVAVGRPGSTGGQIAAYFTGFLLVMLGLVIAGPWLTMIGARTLARRTGRASVLIAGRRLCDNPHGAFRAISGLILALFVSTAAIGVITSITDRSGVRGGPAAGDTLVIQTSGPGPLVGAVGVAAAPVSIPDATLHAIETMHGVRGITLIHVDPQARGGSGTGPPGLVTCAQLASTPALGRCRAGVTTAAITPDFVDPSRVTAHSSGRSAIWPAATLSAQQVRALSVQAVVVSTDGSGSSRERARTALDRALPDQGGAQTLGTISRQNTRQLAELAHMTDVVIVASLIIAGCSLAVSVTGGISERRRPFSMLRLTGVPVRVLRRVVGLEAAVPLLVVSALSAAMGLLVAQLFLRAQLGESLHSPGTVFYLVVAAGLTGSLAIIASSLPVLERITGPEAARNE